MVCAVRSLLVFLFQYLEAKRGLRYVPSLYSCIYIHGCSILFVDVDTGPQSCTVLFQSESPRLCAPQNKSAVVVNQRPYISVQAICEGSRSYRLRTSIKYMIYGVEQRKISLNPRIVRAPSCCKSGLLYSPCLHVVAYHRFPFPLSYFRISSSVIDTSLCSDSG